MPYLSVRKYIEIFQITTTATKKICIFMSAIETEVSEMHTLFYYQKFLKLDFLENKRWRKIGIRYKMLLGLGSCNQFIHSTSFSSITTTKVHFHFKSQNLMHNINIIVPELCYWVVTLQYMCTYTQHITNDDIAKTTSISVVGMVYIRYISEIWASAIVINLRLNSGNKAT